MASLTRVLPLVIASALFMEQMDSTIIATSLPEIAKDLGTDPVALKLAFTTYLLGMTVFLPISGWLADRFGAKQVFRFAIVVFTASSVACGLSTGLHWLVVARALQGMGGALMVPVGRVIMLRAVSKSEIVDAMAWLTIPALIGPTLGPPLGGFITTYFDWRYIFWINLPFGILAFSLATWLMPDIEVAKPPPLDGTGFVLSGLGLTLTVFGGTMAGRGVFANWQVAAMIVSGLLMLWAYVIYARRATNPILDLKLFGIASFRQSIIGGNLFRIAVGATPFLLPLLLQLGFDLSAFQSGMVTSASAFGAFLMKFTVGRLIRRFGFRDLLVFNSTLCCLAIAAVGFISANTPLLVMAGLLLVGGFLRSLQFTALNALAYADISPAEMARANPLYTVMQQLSLAIGVAVAAGILDLQLWWSGRTQLLAADFSRDVVIVALISATAYFSFLRLPKDAGANVSGKLVEQ